MNWIESESEFAALRYFALNGTDHRSHGEQNDAIGAYVRWRNQRAEPEREFALNSKIRLPDYLPTSPDQDRCLEFTCTAGAFDDDWASASSAVVGQYSPLSSKEGFCRTVARRAAT